jgi:hypothetical protein
MQGLRALNLKKMVRELENGLDDISAAFAQSIAR